MYLTKILMLRLMLVKQDMIRNKDIRNNLGLRKSFEIV